MPVAHKTDQNGGRCYEGQKTSRKGDPGEKGVEARPRVHREGRMRFPLKQESKEEVTEK